MIGAHKRGPVWMPGLIVGAWWVSVVWLTLAAFGIGYWFFKWLVDKDNPARYEYAIGAAIVSFYSWPAGLGVLVAGVAPRTGLSLNKRVAGIALLLLCIGALLILDYLQARYR